MACQAWTERATRGNQFVRVRTGSGSHVKWLPWHCGTLSHMKGSQRYHPKYARAAVRRDRWHAQRRQGRGIKYLKRNDKLNFQKTGRIIDETKAFTFEQYEEQDEVKKREGDDSKKQSGQVFGSHADGLCASGLHHNDYWPLYLTLPSPLWL